MPFRRSVDAVCTFHAFLENLTGLTFSFSSTASSQQLLQQNSSFKFSLICSKASGLNISPYSFKSLGLPGADIEYCSNTSRLLGAKVSSISQNAAKECDRFLNFSSMASLTLQSMSSNLNTSRIVVFFQTLRTSHKQSGLFRLQSQSNT